MVYLARSLLVSIIVLSLLVAPCLAILAPIGGAAHAAHVTMDAAGAQDIHGEAHPSSHSHDHARAEHNNAPPHVPGPERSDCCCECDGWIAAKTVKQLAAPGTAFLPRPAYDALAINPTPAMQASFAFGAGRSITALTGGHSHALGAGPVYAVTGRLRI